MNKKSAFQLLLMSLVCCLMACSGGSGGSGDSGTNTAPSSTTTTTSNTSTSNTPSNASTPAASSSTVQITWDIPTNREDGSALLIGDIQGYEIYYFMNGTPQAGTVITIGNPSMTTFTTSPLAAGTYFFAISTIDTNGIYSDLSDYVSVTIQ